MSCATFLYRCRMETLSLCWDETAQARQPRSNRGDLDVLLSEQNLHFAQAVADLAVIIESGTQVYSGTLKELNAQPEIRDAYLAA